MDGSVRAFTSAGGFAQAVPLRGNEGMEGERRRGQCAEQSSRVGRAYH
jgi:hypothetical protein